MVKRGGSCGGLQVAQRSCAWVGPKAAASGAMGGSNHCFALCCVQSRGGWMVTQTSSALKGQVQGPPSTVLHLVNRKAMHWLNFVLRHHPWHALCWPGSRLIQRRSTHCKACCLPSECSSLQDGMPEAADRSRPTRHVVISQAFCLKVQRKVLCTSGWTALIAI